MAVLTGGIERDELPRAGAAGVSADPGEITAALDDVSRQPRPPGGEPVQL